MLDRENGFLPPTQTFSKLLELGWHCRDLNPVKTLCMQQTECAHLISQLHNILLFQAFFNVPSIHGTGKGNQSIPSQRRTETRLFLMFNVSIASHTQDSKLLSCWYRSPFSLHKIIQLIPDQFWACPWIQPFWHNIFNLCHLITGRSGPRPQRLHSYQYIYNQGWFSFAPVDTCICK